VKLGKTARDTCAMLSKAYGREAMKKSSVFERHKQFIEGCENMMMMMMMIKEVVVQELTEPI
jgi:hypothetical protein